MSEIERLKERCREFNEILRDQMVTMQAAWIEWRHGRGADAAMEWIHNTLVGSGFIPDEREPYGTEAQAFFDLNRSNPFQECGICGRPSYMESPWGAACSDEHARELEEKWKASQP